MTKRFIAASVQWPRKLDTGYACWILPKAFRRSVTTVHTSGTGAGAVIADAACAVDLKSNIEPKVAADFVKDIDAVDIDGATSGTEVNIRRWEKIHAGTARRPTISATATVLLSAAAKKMSAAPNVAAAAAAGQV